jgi:hypothetical protein
LQDRRVRQWLDGVEPAWTVLNFDSCRQAPRAMRPRSQGRQTA